MVSCILVLSSLLRLIAIKRKPPILKAALFHARGVGSAFSPLSKLGRRDHSLDIPQIFPTLVVLPEENVGLNHRIEGQSFSVELPLQSLSLAYAE